MMSGFNTTSPVSDGDVDAYNRDGVVALRRVISADWITRMRSAVDRVISSPTAIGGTYGAFSHDMFLWRHDNDFRSFAMDSALPGIARALMRTNRLNLFFDQLLVKEPGLTAEIKWHQDLQTFPVTGNQAISIWVPFDPASTANGAVSYARGSHLWGTIFRDRNYRNGSGPEVPPPADMDIVTWELDPGDVVVHHPLTLHGSPGNSTAATRRRALSVRYAGDDIRFHPKEPNFMSTNGIPLPDLAEGAPLDHEMFPDLTATT
jgi:ectoine hydroxylase-related dioxygenase (phytanoyl-CoA dioxygenase family)